MNILLIGLRGSGKTTVGRALAARLGRPFVDLDERTASVLGAQTAARAWSARGEPTFRRAEARALREAISMGGQVVALGGGTPTAPGVAGTLVREARTGRALIVYLRASTATLRDRLLADPGDRPSLTGAPVADEVQAVFARRDPLFRKLAGAILLVDGVSTAAIVERLAQLAA